MSIAGKMLMDIVPGLFGDKSEKNISYDNLKRLITKLNLPSNVKVNELVDEECNDSRSIQIFVPDNCNFWFQLTQLPKLLIPNFWELSDDELEKKRLELIANDGWGIEHMKKLAMQIRGGVIVNEIYDSSAHGRYSFMVYIDDENCNSVSIHNTGYDGVLDYAKALKKQISCVKDFNASLEKKGYKVHTEKKHYWGMFK